MREYSNSKIAINCRKNNSFTRKTKILPRNISSNKVILPFIARIGIIDFSWESFLTIIIITVQQYTIIYSKSTAQRQGRDHL